MVEPMVVLVLGGTSFVGRWITIELLARGHRATLFTRGVTGSELFPGVDRLTGDRETGDYKALAGGRWDAVVDVSGYVPRHVRQAAAALDGRVGRYLFISTGAVYDRAVAGSQMIIEQAARRTPYRDSEEINADTYGALKVACEDDLLAHYGARATIVRPGIVAGPWDSSDRFTYWVRRTARGGRVALPGRPDQPVQVIDARDLASLVVTLLERELPGAFNAAGPQPDVTLGQLILTCAAAAGSTVELVLVTPLAGFPLVVSDGGPCPRVSAAAAIAVGMPMTALLQTALDTLIWDRERGEPPLSEGYTPDEERAALHRL